MNLDLSKVLITVPDLNAQGGVASFFNGILPHFSPKKIVPLKIGGSHEDGWILNPLVDQFRFQQSLRQIKPSLIHLNPSLGIKSFLRDGIFAWQAIQKKIPIIIFWHGWDKSFERLVNNKLLWFFSNTFGKANAFIVLGSEFKQKLRDWGITVPIYLATTNVDEKLMYGFDIKEKIDKIKQAKEIKILFLARLEREKGIFETVEALKLLLDKKLPVSLTVAGDGKRLDDLKNFSYSLNLTADQIHFTGFVRNAEKISIFESHHIYCLPTNYGEGLPTSVIEAMAFGLPIVTRSVGGLKDMFIDQKMGLIVNSKKTEEIAERLEELIIDPDRMITISRYNAGYAKDNFMSTVVANKLLAIYKKSIHEFWNEE